ncbi:MAG: NAD-dependent epimerase/dehydratase family protein [Planctomycetota bacterium]
MSHLQHRHRILILGCGYVGSALAKRLVRNGHDVVATTTTPSRAPRITELGAAPAVLLLHETERLHDALVDREFVYLCVSAGRTGQSYGELYAEGTRRFVAACRDTPVRRIAYTSSTRVYAQDDGSWVDEDSPTEPPDEDGRALVQAERTLLDAPSNGFLPPESTVSILRLGGIHGPGREFSSRIHRAAGNKRTDGDAFVNLIHLNDIVEVMVRIPETRYHGVINVCDGRPMLRRELYDREIARAGLSPIRWGRRDRGGSGAHGGPPRGKRVSNERLRHLLGLTPQPVD